MDIVGIVKVLHCFRRAIEKYPPRFLCKIEFGLKIITGLRIRRNNQYNVLNTQRYMMRKFLCIRRKNTCYFIANQGIIGV